MIYTTFLTNPRGAPQAECHSHSHFGKDFLDSGAFALLPEQQEGQHCGIAH